MTIQVSCNNCGKAYNVSDNIAGRQIRCKECETIIYVPAEELVEGVEILDDDDDEFGEHAALPPRRRRSSGPAYEDHPPQGQGLSGTQVVLLVVGAGFLMLLLACGGVAYMVISKGQEIIAEVQEGIEKGIEEAAAEAKAAREQRAAEMAEAELAPLDLAAVGLPLVIDMPKGTTVEAVENSNSVDDDETDPLTVYFHYGNLIEWQMSQESKYETVEDLKKYVQDLYELPSGDIEIVNDQTVIYKFGDLGPLFGDGAVYDFMALVKVGDDRLVFQESAAEYYSREEVEYFANCIKTLRPQDQSAEETPSDETPVKETTPEEAPATETPTAETPAAETPDEEPSAEVGEEQ